MHEAYSRQNSSVQDVTQGVSRTMYVIDMKQRAGFFFHDSQFFFIPGNTEVVILFHFRELLYERRIDGRSEQMSSSSRRDWRV